MHISLQFREKDVFGECVKDDTLKHFLVEQDNEFSPQEVYTDLLFE